MVQRGIKLIFASIVLFDLVAAYAMLLKRCQVFQISNTRRFPKLCRVCSMMSTSPTTESSIYLSFLKEKAKAPNPPRRIDSLVKLLELKGMQMLNPEDRKGLNPFVIPIAKDIDGTVVGLLRWPTAPETLPMPLVRTNAGPTQATGLQLLATDVDHYIHRIASEEDFRDSLIAKKSIELSNLGLLGSQKPYEPGSVKRLGYGIERYLMLKVGPFPDVYTWLVQSHLAKSDEISALTAAEKFNEVFPGWGYSYAFYAQVLSKMKHRGMEMKDAAKVALRNPIWTISRDPEELIRVCGLAGYSDLSSLKSIHEKLAEDKQDGKKTEGKAPAQIALDRAAYIMDAVIFGRGSWDEVRDELAEQYEVAGLMDMANFVKI